jgi:hypothetical protein
VSLDVAVSQELSLVFPTPILTRTLFVDSFNDRLARLILSHRRNGEGERTKGGGWQSAPDLLAWPELEVKLLAAEVFDAVERINARGANIGERNLNRNGPAHRTRPTDTAMGNTDGWAANDWGSLGGDRNPYRGRAWANVNGDSHYNALSTATRYQWCAIYHVAIGRPAPDRVANGALELIDPRPSAQFADLNPERFAFGRPLEIEPKAGLLVVFPAWLQYCVHPFFGMGHRISITMNITVEEE